MGVKRDINGEFIILINLQILDEIFSLVETITTQEDMIRDLSGISSKFFIFGKNF